MQQITREQIRMWLNQQRLFVTSTLFIRVHRCLKARSRLFLEGVLTSDASFAWLEAGNDQFLARLVWPVAESVGTEKSNYILPVRYRQPHSGVSHLFPTKAHLFFFKDTCLSTGIFHITGCNNLEIIINTTDWLSCCFCRSVSRHVWLMSGLR